MKKPRPPLRPAVLEADVRPWVSEQPPSHQLNPGRFDCAEAGLVLAGGADVVQMLFLGGGLRDGGERLPPGSWPEALPPWLSLGSSCRFPVAWRAAGRGEGSASLQSTPSTSGDRSVSLYISDTGHLGSTQEHQNDRPMPWALLGRGGILVGR